MKIIVDAMGGDNAPKAPVLGAIQAAKDFGVEIVLVGQTDRILEALKEEGIDTLPPGVEIAFASQVVTMDAAPTTVLHAYKDSSMVVGARLLSSGGDAFVSAGSTGALLTVGTLVTKRIKGVKRAAISVVCPTEKGSCVILDVGANNECTPEYLQQFAYMGAFYAEKYLGISDPRVAILNNGAEETKGRELQKETYALLKDAGDLHFIGNVEARDVPLGGADVVVCDGFSGNILLKSVEGTATFMAHKLKEMFTKSAATKLGYLLCRSGVADFKKLLDSREVGGSMFLGIQKPVVKAHGSSDDYAMMNAIRQAKICVETGVCQAIRDHMDQMNAPSGETPAET